MTKDCVKLYDLSCIYSLYEFTKNNIKEKIWFAEDWGFSEKKFQMLFEPNIASNVTRNPESIHITKNKLSHWDTK